MRATEFLTEGRNTPVICVDVQPEYSGMLDGAESSIFSEIIEFVAVQQTGPVLMFVNAEDQGLTGDTVNDVMVYWEDTVREIKGLPSDDEYLDEIQLVTLSDDVFPQSFVADLFKQARRTDQKINGLDVYEVSASNQRGILLGDSQQNPAAYVGFISQKNDTIWQIQNSVTYDPFKGQALAAKIYKHVKEKYKKSIQSDIEQSADARRLWTKTLPAMGIHPMIYDTNTGHVIDPKNNNIDVYSHKDPYRYSWIIEKFDYYSSRDMLQEGSILMPFKGKWCNRSELTESEQLINWSRFQIVDKGYGYSRAYMDANIKPATIIKIIRKLYAEKISDTRELFGGEDSPIYEQGMKELIGPEFEDWMLSDPLTVNWTSVAQLKKFSGAYIVGGGRNECLREVELLMNAFNIKYRRIDSLVY